MVSWILKKMPTQFNGESKLFSSNGAGKVVYPFGKKKETAHHILKLTWNKSQS